ncbi:hypothetical protein HK098_001560 [Nowakowskiella sp. JEL0407]|nr:hypothetical protein HK098_001560 [Nowakowskiella sp. JEL0407]
MSAGISETKCKPLSESKVCSEWKNSLVNIDGVKAYSSFWKSSPLPGTTGLETINNIQTLDNWINEWMPTRSVIFARFGMNASNCITNTPASNPANAIRYMKSATCADFAMTISHPRSTLAKPGLSCSANYLLTPTQAPTLCYDTCKAMAVSMINYYSDPVVCPRSSTSSLVSRKDEIVNLFCKDYTYWSNTTDSLYPCVKAVEEDQKSCGFGYNNMDAAILYCTSHGDDSCCKTIMTSYAATSNGIDSNSSSTQNMKTLFIIVGVLGSVILLAFACWTYYLRRSSDPKLEPMQSDDHYNEETNKNLNATLTKLESQFGTMTMPTPFTGPINPKDRRKPRLQIKIPEQNTTAYDSNSPLSAAIAKIAGQSNPRSPSIQIVCDKVRVVTPKSIYSYY